MKNIEPPADLVCHNCGASFFEYSHTRSMYDHEAKREVRIAQFVCQWCLVYEPTKHLRSWDLEDDSSLSSEDIVLESGRYKGQHLSDVAEDPRGLRYLEKVAEKDSKVRTFLDSLTKSESSR